MMGEPEGGRGRHLLEHAAARVLYFHNTINTHYILMTALGLLVLAALGRAGWAPDVAWADLARPAAALHALALLLGMHLLLRWCDFYPPVMAAALPMGIAAAALADGNGTILMTAVGVNVALFALTHLALFGGPYVVIFGAWSSPVRGLWNSLFTLAPTTASFWVCQFCTNTLTLALLLRPAPRRWPGLLFLGSFVAAAAVARACRPRTRASATFLPPPGGPLARRVLLLSVDGLSLNLMRKARTPFLDALAREWTHAPRGAVTVYRALTNPAFASMMTGVPPEVHSMRDNNICNRIRVEGLPDYLPARIYGSVHMRHFAKPHWDTRIVPITRTGFETDDVLARWLLEDLEKSPGLRLQVVDFSNVDMSAHAFSAWSAEYRHAIEDADRRLERLFARFEEMRLLDDTAVIVTSDHGQSCLDHSYLLSDDEKYVPLILCGAGIRRGLTLAGQPSIMDFCPTIAFLLGERYPQACRARVLVEAFASAAPAEPEPAEREVAGREAGGREAGVRGVAVREAAGRSV